MLPPDVNYNFRGVGGRGEAGRGGKVGDISRKVTYQ